MADAIWGTGRRLDESLFREAYEFEFFQAVRLLSRMDGKQPARKSTLVGEVDGVVRFAIHPSLSFPPSPLVALESNGDDIPPRLTVAFFGLIGPDGILPVTYTETAVHQRFLGDPSFAAFFDIFHHRLLSLLYRAWEKQHFVIGYERAVPESSACDALTEHLFDFIGMGTAGMRGRLPFPDVALLRYTGLLAQRPHSAESLRALLRDFLGIPISVEQFLGRWHPLDETELCVVGTDDPSTRLGEGAVAGDMAWSRQAVIRIVVGPLDTVQFFAFLPDGEAFRETTGLIRWFLGPTTDFEVQPVLAAGESPYWCSLGEPRTGGPRLGWDSWLTDEPFQSPSSEAIFAESERVCMEE
jgi:type VI secretion system protein ImpH